MKRKQMRRSVAMPTDVHDQLRRHLLRADGQEDLCFALWRPSTGATRTTALVYDVLLPDEGDRHVHGTASFESEYFLRAAAAAEERGAGVAFIHSHPAGRGWQGMSGPDVETETRHAPRAFGATGLPLVGLTMAKDGALSARFWERRGDSPYERSACENARVVGEGLTLTWDDAVRPPPPVAASQVRTVSAWGPTLQASLARLRVGVVGAGSVGALVAEALVRTGVAEISLIDFDTVEEINLDRLLHARPRDARLMRSKVETLRRGLLRGATAIEPTIAAHEFSVVENDGFRAALDCDVIFSCVDRPWPRAALNLLAYAHLIPVIDAGLRMRQLRSGGLRVAFCVATTTAPGRRCLECLGQYDPAHVSAERDGSLDDEQYIERLPEDSALRARENIFGFSLGAAGFAVSQFVSTVVAPGGVSNIGAQRYDFKLGHLSVELEHCNAGCPYSAAIATGDSSHARFLPTGRHLAAEARRAERHAARRSRRLRLAQGLDDLLERLGGHT
jgi:molybdopterin-synthase adenylyltransferase